ncbi:MAG TPA: vWA domain-containing protein, partial [Nannocystis sp.]
MLSCRSFVPPLALFVLAGCGDSGGSASASATGLTGATSVTSATGLTSATGASPTTGATSADSTTTTAAEPPTTSGTGADTTGAAHTTTGTTDALPKLDVGGPVTGGDTTGGPATGGCEKVDFLFVVDNSGSMADEQMNLINSFPGFISTITQTLDAQDYHIMAVSTDNGKGTGLMSSCVNGECNCTPAPVCCQNACGQFGQTCNGFPCDNLPLSQCDFEYGTGREYDADG